MSLSAVHSHRQSIVDEISKSIDQALSNRSAGEPQLVANLVFYLTRDHLWGGERAIFD